MVFTHCNERYTSMHKVRNVSHGTRLTWAVTLWRKGPFWRCKFCLFAWCGSSASRSLLNVKPQDLNSASSSPIPSSSCVYHVHLRRPPRVCSCRFVCAGELHDVSIIEPPRWCLCKTHERSRSLAVLFTAYIRTPLSFFLGIVCGMRLFRVSFRWRQVYVDWVSHHQCKISTIYIFAEWQTLG